MQRTQSSADCLCVKSHCHMVKVKVEQQDRFFLGLPQNRRQQIHQIEQVRRKVNGLHIVPQLWTVSNVALVDVASTHADEGALVVDANVSLKPQQ